MFSIRNLMGQPHSRDPSTTHKIRQSGGSFLAIAGAQNLDMLKTFLHDICRIVTEHVLL